MLEENIENEIFAKKALILKYDYAFCENVNEKENLDYFSLEYQNKLI